MKAHEGPSGDIMVGIAAAPVAGESFTLSDTVPVRTGDNDYVVPSRYLLIGAAGAIKVTTNEGQDVLFASGELAVGVMHPIAVTHVWATGTAVAVAKIKVGY